MSWVLTALGALITPLENYAEQKLASIGAAFGAGFMVIANGFLPDQRASFSQCLAYWQAKYAAAVAAGSSTLDAIGVASTATLNEFVSDETAEGAKEIRAIITLLESSVTNSLTPSTTAAS